MLPGSLKLSRAQARIWRAIADYLLEHGYPPAIHELSTITNHSQSVVSYALDRLAERGYILLASKNNNGNRPARSYRLLVWPMECAKVPGYQPVRSSTPEELKRQRKPQRKFVRSGAQSAQQKPADRKQKRGKKPKVVATAQKPQPRQGKERPAWWYQTVDHALAAELDVKPRTLRVLLGLGANTVNEATMLLETRPEQVRNLGIERDLRQALAKFERLKEAS